MPATISSIHEYFSTLDERFVSAAAQGIRVVYQFEIGGPTGGTWHTIVDDGSFTLHEGSHEHPTTTLKMRDDDYVKMVNGLLAGPKAFMTGKLRVSGSIPMAQKMKQIFPQG